MSYTALYRKWRPFQFEDVKGQDHIVQTLQNQIMAERIGHAYLFCGTRGTGKTSIAKVFAKAVNCKAPIHGSPCNECAACKSIASGSSMNVVEIDAASNNGVDNIREIREEVQYSPTEGRYRVYIIDEVHMLSTGAFNALLKTLEEPPSYVIFILATTEVHKIPITVLSRCQRYDFKRITIETISVHLRKLAGAEQIEVEEKALRYIAKMADGSLRDALSLLDQCAAFHYGEQLSYDNVLEVLGTVDTSVFSQLLRAVIDNRTTDCIYHLEELVMQGRELGQFVIDFTWYMRNLLLVKTTDDAEDMLNMSSENLAALKEESQLVDIDTLMRYIRIFSELSNQMRYGDQKRVLIELAFIKLTKPVMEHNLDSVLQRLTQIEKQLEQGIFLKAAGDEKPKETKPKPETPAVRKVIPKTQLQDLNLIRDNWNKITTEMGMAIRPALRETVVEPIGDSALCIVFSDQTNFNIGSRPAVLEELQDYVVKKYSRNIPFKSRLKDGNEIINTIYVSEDELKSNIHMDIIIED